MPENMPLRENMLLEKTIVFVTASEQICLCNIIVIANNAKVKKNWLYIVKLSNFSR